MEYMAVFITIGKGCRTVTAVLLFCALTLLPFASNVFAQTNRPDHNQQAQCNALFARGADIEKQGDYAGAGFNYAECRELAKIHKLPQMEAAALHRLAVIEARSKKFSKSAEMFRAAAALDKKNVMILCDFAQLYADRRMYDDAETILKNALMMEPNNRKVLYGLGFTIAQQRDREAEGCRYLKLALGEAQGYRELAKIYRTKGNLNQAEYAEQKAVLAAANPAAANPPPEPEKALSPVQANRTQPPQLKTVLPETALPKPSLPLPHSDSNSNIAIAAGNNAAAKPPVPVLTVTPPAVVHRNKEDLLRLETKEISDERNRLQMAASAPPMRDPFLDAMYIPAPAASPAVVFPAVQATAHQQPVLIAGLSDAEKMRFKNPVETVKPEASSADFAVHRTSPGEKHILPEFPPAKPPQTNSAGFIREDAKKSEPVTFIRPESGSVPKTDVKLVKIPLTGKNGTPKNEISKNTDKPDDSLLPESFGRASGPQMLRIIPNPEGSPSIVVEPTPPVGIDVSGNVFGDVSKSDAAQSRPRRTPLVGPRLVDSESQAALLTPLPKFTSLGGVRKIPGSSIPQQTAAVQIISADQPSGQRHRDGPYTSDSNYTAKADFVLKVPVPAQPEDIRRMPPPHTEITDWEAKGLLKEALDRAALESVEVADNSRHHSPDHLPRYTSPESIPVRNQAATEHQFVPNTAPNVLAFGIAEKIPPAQSPPPTNSQAEQVAAATVFSPQVLDFAVKETPEIQKTLAAVTPAPQPQPELPLPNNTNIVRETPQETLRDPFLAAFKEQTAKTSQTAQQQETLPSAVTLVRAASGQHQESAPGFAASRPQKPAAPEEPAGFARTKR
jgi:tetratricopeptide (TPR) repeat protein